MGVVVVLRVSNIASTTATASRDNDIRRASAKQQKGEHDRHCLRCRFPVIVSLPSVYRSRRSPMLSRDDFESKLVVGGIESHLFEGVTY
jgi:hypothetical protein